MSLSLLKIVNYSIIRYIYYDNVARRMVNEGQIVSFAYSICFSVAVSICLYGAFSETPKFNIFSYLNTQLFKIFSL